MFYLPDEEREVTACSFVTLSRASREVNTEQ